MFRLSEDQFRDDLFLNKIITAYVTKILKNCIEEYFYESYKTENDEKPVHLHIKSEQLTSIIPAKLFKEIENLISEDAEVFIAKKISQILIDLHQDEEITPDIFNEYLIYIILENSTHQEVLSNHEIIHLKKLLKDYYKKRLDDNCKGFLNPCIRHIINSLQYPQALISFDDETETNLLYWDVDFDLFNTLGFERTMVLIAYSGMFIDYGEEYTKKIFTSVGTAIPQFLIDSYKSKEQIEMERMERIKQIEKECIERIKHIEKECIEKAIII